MFRLFFITILTIQRLEGATASEDCGTNGENWMGLSGNQNLPNQPLEEIKSACDCDDQCTNESDCEYWVYVASSNACWLKKNFDRVIDDSNCISGRKKSCEVKGENWMGLGEDQNLPNQPLNNIDSSRDCAEDCRKESDCEYWVYDESSRACWLKRDFERVEKNSNSISGWKKSNDCCGVKGENWMGSGEGQNLPNQPLDDVISSCECDEKCSQESDCEYWVYDELSRACWLKRDFERVDKNSNSISGWKKYSGCGVNGENWMGSGDNQNLPNQPIQNVPNACDCDEKCSSTNGCEYWVHVEDSDVCWLKRNFEKVVEDSNCISGLKKGCGVNGENWMGSGEGQNLPNQPLSNVGSACDCENHCNDKQECEYWVYDENTGACWLKKGFVKAVEDSNAISGTKKGCGINGENWMGSGDDQNLPDQPIPGVASSCDCNKHCSTEPNCEYWVYVVSSGDCWLKRNFEKVAKDEKCFSGRKEEIPEKATGKWVLGDKGKTCQYTCALSGKTCNAAMQSTLFTNELLEKAMAEAGHECGSFHSPDSYAGTPLATGRSDDDCTPIKEGVTSSCTENRVARYQALCYCE